jgi:hypothetical protein
LPGILSGLFGESQNAIGLKIAESGVGRSYVRRKPAVLPTQSVGRLQQAGLERRSDIEPYIHFATDGREPRFRQEPIVKSNPFVSPRELPLGREMVRSLNSLSHGFLDEKVGPGL